MSKKNKRKLQQLIAKKQQIQQLQQGVISEPEKGLPLVETTPKVEAPSPARQAPTSPLPSLPIASALGLGRLLVSLTIVVVLFLGTVIFNRQAG